MTRSGAGRTLLTGAALAVAGLLIVGCGPNGSSSSTSGSAYGTASSSAAASAVATGQPAASAPTPATTFRRVPLHQPDGTFDSPSGNIECQLGLAGVLCENDSQSVTMGTSGSYQVCKGDMCLSNGPTDTPTLAYGTETGVGPYLCQSATTGITCTAGGKGFQISTSGITSVSGATFTVSSSPVTTKQVPMQTSAGGEFVSPSGNIGCQVSPTRVYCQSDKPARSVTMGVTGTYKTCTGETCLGNSGENTPTLAYESETGVGPFQCLSATTGITCIAAGKGFQISTSGVTPW